MSGAVQASVGGNVGLTSDGLEGAVGVFVDDVHLGRVGPAMFDLVDLEHVEVLRGPPTVLFGRSTTAGAVVEVDNVFGTATLFYFTSGGTLVHSTASSGFEAGGSNVGNFPVGFDPSVDYGLTNPHVGVRRQDERWDLRAWSSNVLDEEFFRIAGGRSTGWIVGIPGDPRTFGLTIGGRL